MRLPDYVPPSKPKEQARVMPLWAVVQTDLKWGMGLFYTAEEALSAAQAMTAAPEAEGAVYVPVQMFVQGVSVDDGKKGMGFKDHRKEVTATSWNPSKGYL